MPAYYNENNAFAAAWLRELVKAKLIADGDVDDRSIKEVQPADLKDYTQCHFFAGIGVWSYSLRNAGFPDNRKVWTGSCPCQPFSAAGKKGGFDDERHLWPDWFRLIRECTPDTIFGEQVASKAGLAWFDLVSTDLEGSGYAVGAADLCAAGVGAPHIRQRLYFVADSASKRFDRFQNPPKSTGRCGAENRGEVGGFSYSTSGSTQSRSAQRDQRKFQIGPWSDNEWVQNGDGRKFPIKPGVCLLVDGTPNRVGRLRGYGNSLVAPVAQAFIESYLEVESDALQS